MKIWKWLGGVAGWAAIVSVAFAYKEVPPPDHVVLPKARTPAESLASIRVAEGFEVELVAAEPMVLDPVDLAWGADGRMWVVEMADYPDGLDGKGKPGGRIRVLESTRGDGKFDKSTLFAEGLRYATSVMPWRDGVLVTQVPEILFLQDTDGDGWADKRTVLFSGIAEGNPQHLVNGLQWSLDGWLHVANGDSGGKIVSAKTGKTVDVGRRDFRIRPDDGGLELLSGSTQVGRNRDDWGNWFGCNNSNPYWHYALDDHYQRRNPHFVPPSAVVSVNAVPGAAPVFPVSETVARFNDPQGRNHFTSACGVMVYRDDGLGAEFAGNLFVGEPVHNLVSRLVLRPAGVTFKGERAATERGSEFFASTDNWSRFVGIRAGPDGALYIADMYRLVVEHPKWIPDAWQKQIPDLRAGAEMGRIYRVKKKGAALRPVPRLDRASASELVEAMESSSGLVRDLAQQQLVWRGAKEAVVAGGLERVAARGARPESRVQALWTLQTLGAVRSEVVHRALQDERAEIRRSAVRLAEALFATEAGRELLGRVIALTEDPDLGVRQQVAYSLGEARSREAGQALARMLRENREPLVRAAAMSSALPHAETLIAALSVGGGADDPLVMEIAASTENARALAEILQAIARRTGANRREQFQALGALLDWLQRNNKSLASLDAAGGNEVDAAIAAAEKIVAAARDVLRSEQAALAERVAAVRVVGRGRSQQREDTALLTGLLTPRAAVELQLAAIEALGRTSRADVAAPLLKGWSGYEPKVRAAVLQLLTSRAAWAQALLDVLEKDRAMLTQIEAGPRMALTQHSTPRVSQRAAEIFKASVDGNREQTIQRYLAAASGAKGEPAKGAEVFARVCSACHTFGTTAPGRLIGPDIAAVKDRSATYLITHILDPNRAVEDRYVLYTAATQDGRALSGMLSGETANSLTLVGLDGAEQVVLRSELRSLTSTGKSLMPDGLENAIDEQAMADLVAFLAGAAASPR